MNGKQFRTVAVSIVAAAGLLSALPSEAKVIDMDGTIYLSGGSASPVGRSAPAG